MSAYLEHICFLAGTSLLLFAGATIVDAPAFAAVAAIAGLCLLPLPGVDA